MKIFTIPAGDRASSGLLPILTIKGNVKFYLHVNKNKEAAFLSKVHMPLCPEFYPWIFGGSAEPHLKTLSLGNCRTIGEDPRSLDNLVDHAPSS